MKSNSIYLLVTYYKKPSRPHQTSGRGFGTDPRNFKYDEQVSISQALKNRDYDQCSVILDMCHRRVIKNSMNPGQSFDELYLYFKTHYPKYIELIEQGLSKKVIN